MIRIEVFQGKRHAAAALYLARHLREADREELAALGYVNAAEAVLESLRAPGLSYLVFSDLVPLAAFGLTRQGRESYGLPAWFLATDDVYKHKRWFLVNAGRILLEWAKEAGGVYNFVSVRNVEAVRWLKRLGAAFEPTVINGRDFYLFRVRGNA